MYSLGSSAMSFSARRKTQTLYIYPFGPQLCLSLLPGDYLFSSFTEMIYFCGILSVFE